MPKLDTSIDRLVEYVKLRKSCTVDDVSKSLGMPSKQIEELSEILAESGLIDIRYEFSGIRLFPKIVRKETDEPIKGKAEKKQTVYDRIESIKRELSDTENMFIFSEKDIRRKVENAKAHFREIEKLDLSGENIPTLRIKIGELEGSIKIFEEKVDSLEKAALEMRKEVDVFQSQLEKQRVSRNFFRMIKLPSMNIVSKVKGVLRRRKKDIADKPVQIQVDSLNQKVGEQ
jgi:hypothetical protein